MCDNNNEEKYSSHCKCNTILRKSHGLINEAEELYKSSDEMIDSKVIDSICTAIESLEKAFELGDQGGKMENDAYDMLDNSGCSDTCYRNSTECKELYRKAEEKFAIESDYLMHALKSLKNAQRDIYNSIEVREIGYKLRDEYKECVHCKNSTCDCDHHR